MEHVVRGFDGMRCALQPHRSVPFPYHAIFSHGACDRQLLCRQELDCPLDLANVAKIREANFREGLGRWHPGLSTRDAARRSRDVAGRTSAYFSGLGGVLRELKN